MSPVRRLFLDTETTGNNAATDRIVEICVADEASVLLDTRVHPTIPIPADMTAIHGITDDDVRNCPTFGAIAPKLAAMLSGQTLVGFGLARFDVPLLANEFARCGVRCEFGEIVDSMGIYKAMNKRNLLSAVRRYLGEKEAEEFTANAHGARADTLATRRVFAAQLVEHAAELHLKSDAELAVFSNFGKPRADIAGKLTFDDAGRLCFNFGTHRGKPITESRETRGYADWLLSRDFPDDTKTMVRNELANGGNK